MKVSTLTAMALLSAVCFASSHPTAMIDSPDELALAPTGSNAAAGIAANSNVASEHWSRIKLPKAHGLAKPVTQGQRMKRTQT